MTRTPALTAALLMLVLAPAASAQTAKPPATPAAQPAPTPLPAPTISDIKGAWKGSGDSIVSGASVTHPPGAPSRVGGTYRLRTQTYTYKVEGQDGQRFWGTMVSDQSANIAFIGMISPDGRRVHFVQRDGFLDGEVVDNDTIQVCYRQATPPTMVAGCAQLKRQK